MPRIRPRRNGFFPRGWYLWSGLHCAEIRHETVRSNTIPQRSPTNGAQPGRQRARGSLKKGPTILFAHYDGSEKTSAGSGRKKLIINLAGTALASSFTERPVDSHPSVRLTRFQVADAQPRQVFSSH